MAGIELQCLGLTNRGKFDSSEFLGNQQKLHFPCSLGMNIARKSLGVDSRRWEVKI
jgi:hypothetical protein